jgi:hypothetical protein
MAAILLRDENLRQGKDDSFLSCRDHLSISLQKAGEEDNIWGIIWIYHL